MPEKLIPKIANKIPLTNAFEPIWNDPQFIIPTLETLRLGDKFIMGDLGHRAYLREYIDGLIAKSSTLDPLNILDLGCGNMRFGRAIATNQANPNQYNYIGIDQMEIQNSFLPRSSLYLKYDLEKYDKIIKPQSQNLVLCAGLIFYLPKSTIIKLFKQALKVLAHGGLMIFNLPHPDLYKPHSINNKVNLTWMRVAPKISDDFLYEMQHFDSLGNSYKANIHKLDIDSLNKFLKDSGFKILKIEVRKNPLEAFQKNQHLQSLTTKELEQMADQNAHLLYFIQKPND